MSSRLRIAVVGATGAVGSVARAVLRERGHEDVRLFASARSAGRVVDGAHIEEATPDALEGAEVDAFLFAIGAAASRELVPHAARSGALCIDKSSAFRMEPDVPLVIPEVNPEALSGAPGLIAVPNCTTIVALMALAPLHRAAGLRSVVLSSYQAVSGAGRDGTRELVEQVEQLLISRAATGQGVPDRDHALAMAAQRRESLIDVSDVTTDRVGQLGG